MGLWDRLSARPPSPIWRYSSAILAVETEEIAVAVDFASGPYRSADVGAAGRDRRLVSLVYSGQRRAFEGTDFVLRRLELFDGKPRVAWEFTTSEPGVLAPERYGRLGSLAIAPVRMGGVAGIDLRSGSVAWVLPSPVPLARPPARSSDGALCLAFLDGSVATLDPTTGRTISARAPAELTPLLHSLPLDAIPVGEKLSWRERAVPEGIAAAIVAVDPLGGADVPVLDVGTARSRVAYDGCLEVDNLLAFRVGGFDAASTTGTTPRRTTYLVDPRRWRVLARVPDTDGVSGAFYSPRWTGTL